ncbi:LppX_LprAFG lipoprotein [Streptomyces palmae]|uniref:LppX_LprAFG lipoprotein n=1 Tax=Streptomyces palmae TaxID=1701085 RepID=A0A4Z0GGS6_9ACTN|nr:LppX_LprAFG lipoprotein [Streptomyces palmae]TGA95451.1 LppX_LprAFG lipoprotein [Streptomyces palmae]
MRRSLILLSSIALLCAGCSGTSDSGRKDGSVSASGTGSPAPVVREALAKTGRGTARIDQKIELGDTTQTFTLDLTGAFDLGRDKGRLTVDFPSGAVDTVEEVFVDDMVYLRGMPNLEGHWGATSRGAAKAHYLLRAPLNDPEHVLRQMASMRQITKVGPEKVNGAAAVRYRGTLDHSTLTLRLVKSMRQKAAQLRDALGGDLPVFADAWIDGSGRVVRARLSFDSEALAHVKVTMDFSDFGKPVKAAAPSPADTVLVGETSGVLLG